MQKFNLWIDEKCLKIQLWNFWKKNEFEKLIDEEPLLIKKLEKYFIVMLKFILMMIQQNQEKIL